MENLELNREVAPQPHEPHAAFERCAKPQEKKMDLGTEPKKSRWNTFNSSVSEPWVYRVGKKSGKTADQRTACAPPHIRRLAIKLALPSPKSHRNRPISRMEKGQVLNMRLEFK